MNVISNIVNKQIKTKTKCVHPFKRIHWIGTQVYCNKCNTTLIKDLYLVKLIKKYPNNTDLGARIRKIMSIK